MPLSITAASVVPTNPQRAKKAVAAVAITQGQVIALVDGAAQLADADHATPEYRRPAGIAVSAASAGQPVLYVDSDDTFTLGATVAAGVPYFLSATAGGIEALTSQASTYPALIGYGVDTTQIKLALGSYATAVATDPTP